MYNNTYFFIRISWSGMKGTFLQVYMIYLHLISLIYAQIIRKTKYGPGGPICGLCCHLKMFAWTVTQLYKLTNILLGIFFKGS